MLLSTPHPGSRGSAHEHDAPSTTTPTPPLVLRNVGPMASRRHPHRHLIATHQLGRPHQLAPPLNEGLPHHRPNPPPPPRPGWHQARMTRGLHERRTQAERGEMNEAVETASFVLF